MPQSEGMTSPGADQSLSMKVGRCVCAGIQAHRLYMTVCMYINVIVYVCCEGWKLDRMWASTILHYSLPASAFRNAVP